MLLDVNGSWIQELWQTLCCWKSLYRFWAALWGCSEFEQWAGLDSIQDLLQFEEFWLLSVSFGEEIFYWEAKIVISSGKLGQDFCLFILLHSSKVVKLWSVHTWLEHYSWPCHMISQDLQEPWFDVYQQHVGAHCSVAPTCNGNGRATELGSAVFLSCHVGVKQQLCLYSFFPQIYGCPGSLLWFPSVVC